jgi:hypothetical protein
MVPCKRAGRSGDQIMETKPTEGSNTILGKTLIWDAAPIVAGAMVPHIASGADGRTTCRSMRKSDLPMQQVWRRVPRTDISGAYAREQVPGPVGCLPFDLNRTFPGSAVGQSWTGAPERRCVGTQRRTTAGRARQKFAEHFTVHAESLSHGASGESFEPHDDERFGTRHPAVTPQQVRIRVPAARKLSSSRWESLRSTSTKWWYEGTRVVDFDRARPRGLSDRKGGGCRSPFTGYRRISAGSLRVSMPFVWLLLQEMRASEMGEGLAVWVPWVPRKSLLPSQPAGLCRSVSPYRSSAAAGPTVAHERASARGDDFDASGSGTLLHLVNLTGRSQTGYFPAVTGRFNSALTVRAPGPVAVRANQGTREITLPGLSNYELFVLE